MLSEKYLSIDRKTSTLLEVFGITGGLVRFIFAIMEFFTHKFSRRTLTTMVANRLYRWIPPSAWKEGKGKAKSNHWTDS